ncbi:MAG: alpha-2-macroglobulin family protein [Tannerellaceae bacterium]
MTIDKPGLYVCVVNAPGSTIKTSLLFSVSRLAALSRHAPNGQTEVLVTDFLSGKPIEGATVNYYNKQGDNLLRVGSLRTNRDGLATLPTMMGRQAYQATLPGDTCSLLSSLYPYGDGRSLSSLSNYQLSLFTDRGIYRPGQTVRFKGIAYTNDTNNPRVVPDKHFTVLLRDANGKEVASKQCTTHAFGSFNGEFTLPAQALNGTFTLQAGEARAYIEVAEYKRPTFNLKLLPVKEEAVFNEPVTILGKAQTYSGVSLQSGTVNYRITECRLLRSYMRTPPKQVAQGETIVNTDGSFAITFCPEKEVEESLSPNAQLYEVTATLTDSKGETEETRTTVSVAAAGILLSLNLPENKEMEKDSVRMQASACTINGSAIRATGTYTLSPFTRSETEEKNVGKPVVEGSFTTDRPFDSAIFAKLPSGRYRICLTSVDSKGRTVTEQEDFILYSKHDKRPPIITPMWLVDERTTCLPGEEASFVFGTSEKKAYILYELFTNDKLIRRERLELSDENRTFRIPFEAEYGVGFVASFTFVKEGKFYTTQVPIYRRQPDRRLSIRPETFRDRLLPGSRETWKFHIQNADSTAMIAEVLAGMYDASLDRISPFAWSFSPIRQVVLTAPRMTGGAGFQTSYRYENQQPDFVAVPEYQYDCLNWQGMMSSNQSNITLRRYSGAVGAVMMKSASAPMAERQNNRLDVQEVSVANMAESVVEAPVSTPSLPQLRENFAETAFFYPALMTNETGDVSLDFILPESNTTWKMQLLAYTEDMKYGLLTREVISQKPLMVLPNLPRFMREGDQVTLTAQVMNQSGKELVGRARLELFDPANDQPVICLTKSEKPFVLPSDSTITVSWSLTVPSGISLIGCRMVADTDSGSDGEQLLIPVLSNELLITESTPFYLIGDGEQRIQLKESGRSVSRRPFKLTLEMSSNPIWYAVQALPTLTTPEDDNLLSWFASYYSNTLASYIVQTNPRLKKVIDQWTAQGGTAATLLSNLEKNAELKAILLSETPWVLSANNETEQKQRLALLFDLNRAASARMAALQQLQQQQQPDGGWSWMKGGRSSRSITLQVLKGMADLTALNAVEYNQEEKEMQIKALAFVDNCLRQDYEQAKKGQYLKKSLPTAEQLEYLYVRSAYRDIPEPGNAREAIRFYTNQAAKQWSLFSLYGKAETALLMHRNGQKATASAIFGWLRKTATVNMEMGMYWANNRREANYFTSPIDTHCLLMALFNELSPDTADTDRMKQWLLNQKRTQNWESVPATVNAIYALLLTGSDWLGDNNTCTVQWGSHAFNTVTGEAATGYIKEVIPAKEITPQMNILNVQKTGKAPAWGAIYNQYFEAIDQVAAQSGALRIDKKLFVETNSSAGRQIHPVTLNTPLCIGDKVVVRLTLSSDREMDYVALKDQRAGCFEPSGQLSGYEYRNGLSYYRAPGDVSENFYFDRLPKGTFVLEYSVYASRVGEYAGGVSTLQCLYAPEYVAHTAGERIRVNE